MPVEVFKCCETIFPWNENHQKKLQLNKLGFDIFLYLTSINLRKNPFYALPSHVDPSSLVFWEANALF